MILVVGWRAAEAARRDAPAAYRPGICVTGSATTSIGAMALRASLKAPLTMKPMAKRAESTVSVIIVVALSRMLVCVGAQRQVSPGPCRMM